MAAQTTSLAAVQAARKGVLALCLMAGLAVVALTQAAMFGHQVHELVEALGIGLLVVCILGRVWCSLYIGGRKKAELVTTGPYSVVRNPLYVFSLIGAAGVGAQAGSLALMAVCPLVVWAVFATVVRREEQALAILHGEAFAAYRQRTPVFLPDFRLWRDEALLTVRPDRVAMTFVDGLIFLLAIPAAEGLEQLQHMGYLPTMLSIA